jgi:hypothetical protein
VVGFLTNALELQHLKTPIWVGLGVLCFVTIFAISLRTRTRKPPKPNWPTTSGSAIPHQVDCASATDWPCYAALSVVSLPPYRHESVCPKCKGSALAMSIAIGLNVRMVRYICAICGHEWCASQDVHSCHVLPFRRQAASP